MLNILEKDCPFSENKKIKDTHCLYLMPSEINNLPFSFKTLLKLLKKEEPKNFK